MTSSFKSLSTAELLSRQASMIADVVPKAANFGLLTEKTVEQIKQEKNDLRHTKNFTRVLKLHSLMPQSLRKATEPPRVKVKDFSLDVENHVKEKRDQIKAELYTRDALETLSTESNDTAQQERQEKDAAKEDKRQTMATEATGKKRIKPIWELELAKSAAVLAKRKAAKRHRLQYQPNPLGAVVVIDKECTKQIQKLSSGQFFSQNNLKSSMKSVILNLVNKTAIEEVNKLRKRLSMLSGSPDQKEKQKVDQKFMKAAEVQTLVNIKVRNRPHDRVRILEPKDKRGRGASKKDLVSHNHFVKLSFEQLPADLQKQVLELKQSSQARRPGTASSVALARKSNKRAQSSQLAPATVRFDAESTNGASLTKSALSAAQKRVSDKNPTSAKCAQILGQASLAGALQMRGNGHQMQSSIRVEPRFESSTAVTNVDPQSRKTCSLIESPLLQKRRKFTSMHDVSALAQLQTQKSQAQGTDLSVNKAPGATSSAQLCNKIQVKDQLQKRGRRPVGASISNLSATQIQKLNEKVKGRPPIATSKAPMRRKISTQQQPFQLSDDCYLVRQSFQYEKQQKYKIEFGDIAVFEAGCLTCGNENAEIENYGERYCCTTCQKSLQTPEGDHVTLRASYDGRFILAQAWKYSKPLKNVKVNIDDLRIRGGHRCHATFAGEKGDIIVLLDEVNEDYVYR